MQQLRGTGCDLLTIGQYMAPSKKLHLVIEFIVSEKFEAYTAKTRKMSYLEVACVALVRISYREFDMNRKAKMKLQ